MPTVVILALCVIIHNAFVHCLSNAIHCIGHNIKSPQRPSIRHLWTRLWRYLWTDLHQIWNTASPYVQKKIFLSSSIQSCIHTCATINRLSLTAVQVHLRNDLNCVEWDVKPCSTNLGQTINVVCTKWSCFCVDYFNKMAELVFFTIFNTHMCKKS